MKERFEAQWIVRSLEYVIPLTMMMGVVKVFAGSKRAAAKDKINWGGMSVNPAMRCWGDCLIEYNSHLCSYVS